MMTPANGQKAYSARAGAEVPAMRKQGNRKQERPRARKTGPGLSHLRY
jgi:hypothetical protein